jgi:hypothetical protein
VPTDEIYFIENYYNDDSDFAVPPLRRAEPWVMAVMGKWQWSKGGTVFYLNWVSYKNNFNPVSEYRAENNSE